MPTVITHAIVGMCIADIMPGVQRKNALYYSTAAVCAMLPDADVISFKFGIDYASVWGHRGFSHSFLFAGLVGVFVVLALYRKLKPSRLALVWSTFFLVTASHGVLDALTNGGLGVGFFSPFDTNRFFFDWRPIEVASIGMRFFRTESLLVLQSELVWIIIPCLALWAFLRLGKGLLRRT